MAKKKRKKLTAREKKWKQEFQMKCLNSLNAKRRELFNSTTLEGRRKFIGLIHEGRTIGAAAAECDMELEVALEVLRRNTKTIEHHYIVQAEDVV